MKNFNFNKEKNTTKKTHTHTHTEQGNIPFLSKFFHYILFIFSVVGGQSPTALQPPSKTETRSHVKSRSTHLSMHSFYRPETNKKKTHALIAGNC